jgi:DNA-binding CsgD family transcriptional regulator
VAAVTGGIARPEEWRRVREFALEDRTSAAVLAIQGEAGAGKSTLWRVAVQAAVDAGRHVHRSEPSVNETDSSFVGLSDLIGDVLPVLRDQLPGPQREALEVALLLRAPGGEPPTPHAVGLAVLTALRVCTYSAPLVLAVDDAQWLDEASLDALIYALRRAGELPVSLFLGARTAASPDPLTAGEPPPPQVWRRLLSAFPAPVIVDLTPLDMWQIQNILPADVTAAEAHAIATQSRGNPFWAKEILASMRAGDTQVPRLALSVAGRLSRSLSAEAADALAVVAACGRPRLPEALAVLSELSDPAGAVDAAVLAGVVVESGGRISVSHPLIGAAAVESLPPGRRARLYRSLAAGAADPERRAHFLALAEAPGPDTAVARALDEAAEAAHGRAGYAAAAHFAAQAVAFTPATDAAILTRRRIRAGELLFLAGEVEQSLAQLELVDIDGLATEDLERALPVLLDMVDLVHGSAAARAMVSRAVETVGTDPRRRALVLALGSDSAYGIDGRRSALATEAISCAEKAGEAAAPSLHRALVNLVAAKVYAGEGLDRALLDRAEKVESSLGPVRPHDTADLYRGVWSAFLDDLDTARAALQRCIDRARADGDDYPLCMFLSYLAVAEELAGDYAAAAATLEAERTVAQWHDWPLSPWHVKPRCDLLIAEGDLDGALRLAAEDLPDDPSVPLRTRHVGACVRGRANIWRGDLAAAATHLERAVEYADELDWADPGIRDRADVLLAEVRITLGRVSEAEQTASWLQQIGTRLGRIALIGDSKRISALAAAHRGDLDGAAALAGEAVAAHESSSSPTSLARSLLVLGQIERRRKGRRESRAALLRALEVARSTGHKPLVSWIEAEIPRLAPGRAASDLTAAEQRVADLIAEGSTNRDIAAALFVSVRTVETHVASIYRKLGVRTRAELVRRLSRTSVR